MTILSTSVATKIAQLSVYDEQMASEAQTVANSLKTDDTDESINAEDSLLSLLQRVVELERKVGRLEATTSADTSTLRRYSPFDL